jgi:hypothetical protein
MTPFIGVLVWLCEHIVPGRKHRSRSSGWRPPAQHPTQALVCVMNALAGHDGESVEGRARALRGYKNGKPVSVDAIKKIEDEVDGMQGGDHGLSGPTDPPRLSGNEQAQAIPVLMHCVNDAETHLRSRLPHCPSRRFAEHGDLEIHRQRAPRIEGHIEKSCTHADLTLESLRGGPAGSSKAISIIMQDMKIMTHESFRANVDRLQKWACKPNAACSTSRCSPR